MEYIRLSFILILFFGLQVKNNPGISTIPRAPIYWHKLTLLSRLFLRLFSRSQSFSNISVLNAVLNSLIGVITLITSARHNTKNMRLGNTQLSTSPPGYR